MTTTRYTVTIDIPAGISRGISFDDLAQASDFFGEAVRGSNPNGTIVSLIETREGSYKPGWEVLDRATVVR